MPLVLAKGSKTPGHSDENNGAVASLPRNQRCWHGSTVKTWEWFGRRIASEKPTLLAQERKRRTLRAGRSHRFRETNAVGTRSGTTKRARRSVASLPRNQRCWHKNSLRLRIGRSPSRIASEKPTLLARPPGRNDTARARSHRFRETNAVGTSSACSTSWATQSHRFRETNAVGTRPPGRNDTARARSHRFRETNAVGTSSACSTSWATQSHRFRETNAVGTGLSSICLTKGAPRRIASEKPTLLARKRRELRRGGVPVASLPRNQRCWHQEDGEGCAVVKWSHRFRETNAVGTAGRACAAPCRLVASLPRNQRCWHQEDGEGCAVVKWSHRFRETNAVGTAGRACAAPCRLVASLPRNQRCWHRKTARDAPSSNGRIASEKPTLLAQRVGPALPPAALSHRFRETNAVGTSMTVSFSMS